MPEPREPSRRSFLASASASAGAFAATGSLGALRAAAPVHAGGGDRLKIGLCGSGGRGSGAAVQALRAHPENVLWAMADAFPDRLSGSLDGIEQEMGEKKAQVEVSKERQFAGLDCLDQLLKSGVDVVLLASPPGFRPMEIEKCVAAGVHVFAEKPVATDAPGVRRVWAACEEAKKKGLTVVSGLCYRYHDGRRELLQNLHAGAVGEILAIQGTYLTGELWSFPRKPGWSDLEWQLRNWLYYTWLSGDHIAEQHIHTLDVMAWIKQDQYPVRATSLGGRQTRVDPQFGHVFDHFATIYEWADGTRGFSYCRQQNHCARDVNELVLGSEGRANVFQHQITGKVQWRYAGKARDMYQCEHDEMAAAIRAGKPINNGEYMCKSTLMAIQGRMAGYTGRAITWEEAWNSQEVLMPEKLAFDMQVPAVEVARPGLTKFA
jgi:predicted dehydrogenase